MSVEREMVDLEDALLSGPNNHEYTVGDLMLALAEVKKLREEIAQLRTPIRSSLEVLQRMANGIEPFDAGRYKSAVAALPHEVPKLSATVAMVGRLGIADALDRRKGKGGVREELERRGMRLIETEPDPAA